MTYQVIVTEVLARPTLVVAATTTWPEFPTMWKGLLDEVWTYVRANGIDRGCRNVMLYLDERPHVEVGVEARSPGPLTGRIVGSSLPAGQVAMTTHRGGYDGLGAAHRAVIDWCSEHGKRRAGPRWEVYGPHRADPAEVWTEVYLLLA
jgi:effector-binding domain-containing protein